MNLFLTVGLALVAVFALCSLRGLDAEDTGVEARAAHAVQPVEMTVNASRQMLQHWM